MPFGVSNEDLGLPANATQEERARALASEYERLGYTPKITPIEKNPQQEDEAEP